MIKQPILNSKGRKFESYDVKLGIFPSSLVLVFHFCKNDTKANENVFLRLIMRRWTSQCQGLWPGEGGSQCHTCERLFRL